MDEANGDDGDDDDEEDGDGKGGDGDVVGALDGDGNDGREGNGVGALDGAGDDGTESTRAPIRGMADKDGGTRNPYKYARKSDGCGRYATIDTRRWADPISN